MPRSILKDCKVVTHAEVINFVGRQPGSYAFFLGAGASAEARVVTANQICNEIRRQLQQAENPRNPEEWANAELDWDDLQKRYSSCLKRYGNAAQRVEYFRQKLRDKHPSFAHHAVALLMAAGKIKRTCLTTNFDKLLETAFAQQGQIECQPIRTDDEAQFWRELADKCYVIKLHGDYDTHNILNTADETIAMSEAHQVKAHTLLQNAGLVVIGTAGNEKSIQRLFDDLSKERGGDASLSMGLCWGVYLGPRPPANLDQKKLYKLIEERVETGEVSRDIIEMIARNRDRQFCIFPVWGGGNFLLSMINQIGDDVLVAAAERYLDHRMRLEYIFTKAGLSEAAVAKHIASLDFQKSQEASSPQVKNKPETVWKAVNSRKKIEARVVYGDMTDVALMRDPEFRAVRRAVISPEDTCISAGGGVAFSLLKEAGTYTVLNDLSKLWPIGHGDVVVTSGGNLPVHFLLHAAALKIEKDASYSVTPADVTRTMRNALELASALDIGALWIPLMATGTGGLMPPISFRSILKGISEWKGRNKPTVLMIVIFKEGKLSREAAFKALKEGLASFTIKAAQEELSANA